MDNNGFDFGIHPKGVRKINEILRLNDFEK